MADEVGEWWTDLAADLDVTIDILPPDADVLPTPNTVAIILTGGGVERVAEWFRDHRLPRGLPVIAVGADRSRRRALDIVATGATNYFALPDDLEIYPAHFAGSACGRSMSGKPSSTLGFERRYNPALTQPTREAFVSYMLTDLPAPPEQHREIRAANRQGLQAFAPAIVEG